MDIIISLAHQTKHRLHPNYVALVNQNINNLLTIRYIECVKEATWLSPIVLVPKKNGKLKIYIDFRKLNEATKKDPHPLSFTYEMRNIVEGMRHIFF